MSPSCIKCGGNSFSYMSSAQATNGYLIYCTGCGGVVTWTPDIQSLENKINTIEHKVNMIRN